MEQIIEDEICRPFVVTLEQKESFKNDGFIVLRQVLSKEFLDYFKEEFRSKVLHLNTLTKPMEERTTYEKAFLQVINLWKHSKLIEKFVLSKRLGFIAIQLLDVEGVRLYHDQALYKEPSGGITPWHADQYYWPLDTDRCCTAWIPLQDTPLEMGPLGFSPASHLVDLGRSLPISDQSEQKITEALTREKLGECVTGFLQGDVSFHLGWTFHHAGANKTSLPREVMTIIYMDDKMKLTKPTNENQEADRAAFCDQTEIGEIISGLDNPSIYNINS